MTVQVSPSTIPNLEDLAVISTLQGQDANLTSLLNQCQAQEIQAIEPEITALLKELRDRASRWVKSLTFPTKRDEEWRFTDLSPLLQVNFQTPTTQVEIAESVAADFALPEASIRLVFVNGVYAPHLSAVALLPEGLVVSNLAQLPVAYRSKVEKYLAQLHGSAEVFTALNTASLTDAAVVWVAKNQQVETPVHLLFISTVSQTPIVSLPRCLVVAESGSNLTLVEEYRNHKCAQETGEVYFTNTVTEIVLEENAHISHTRIDQESKGAFHIGKSAIAQSRYSRYIGNAITFGSKLSRHHLEVFQTGEGTETTLNGLTLIGGEQVADTHSEIALNHPNGTANQLHKCIIDDRAHAVFNGKIFVPQPAQFTNASQLNRNLLLSPKARVDTKPQLEITADQVKCAHGATVSQLDADDIFYLQSRGINAASARELLLDAFAAEIINRIPMASLRHRLSRCVACRTF
jgi:Fe-S cluster assembly protein SufD